VYNCDVGVLVHVLHQQALQTGLPFEILLMDDASEKEYRGKNSAIHLPYLHYVQLEENAGRSRIRNLLGKQAQYPYLIFMDCDSSVASEDYIKRYIPYFKPDIVCSGGRIYEKKQARDRKYLHWKYGVKREALTAEQRDKKSGFGFMTCNFLIHKPLLENNPFNEDLKGYGHEDTLFGIQLREKGILVRQIDNPLIHSGLEDADVFIEKTEKAMFNLRKIDRILQEKYPDSVEHSALVKLEKRLERMHLLPLVAVVFSVFKPLIKMNLSGSYPSLILFDLYKIGTLAVISSK
jgi:hypothetical protein